MFKRCEKWFFRGFFYAGSIVTSKGKPARLGSSRLSRAICSFGTIIRPSRCILPRKLSLTPIAPTTLRVIRKTSDDSSLYCQRINLGTYSRSLFFNNALKVTLWVNGKLLPASFFHISTQNRTFPHISAQIHTFQHTTCKQFKLWFKKPT